MDDLREKVCLVTGASVTGQVLEVNGGQLMP